ncbi:MAG: pentapeptide repeat-containing protein [Gammaproteobacteria bacterium]|nr:pentapeptide repeat-containing protein [Gammaproteobacteria bacterium]
MKREPLWYIRRKGVVTGPFPVGLIERYVVLGRVSVKTELSADNAHWAVCGEWPEWVAYIADFKLTHESEEHIEALRRWEDERGGYDRRMGELDNVASDLRSHSDRRNAETDDEIEQRQHRHQRPGLIRRYSLSAAIIPIFAVVVFIGFYLALYKPAATGDPVDCSVQATEGINWSYCDLQNLKLINMSLRHSNLQSSNMTGISLEGMDLSDSEMSFSVLTLARINNSNFSNSRMIGVSFRNSLINNTDFKNSDLTYADFSNAEFNNVEFNGARLDHAIWLDRRRCAVNSIGICR